MSAVSDGQRGAGFIQEYNALIKAAVAKAEALPLPQDVIDLVIAARKAALIGDDGGGEIEALDLAAEAFASRVPWDDEPEDRRPPCSTCGGPDGDGPRRGVTNCPECDAEWSDAS